MSDNGGTEPVNQQLFADLALDNEVLTAHMVGPSVGGREAPIISRMVQDRINEVGNGLRYVVLDFSDVTFINSAGLGACVISRTMMRPM